MSARAFRILSGRGERIRTSGLYVPNVALYQAKLHPDVSAKRVSLWRRPGGRSFDLRAALADLHFAELWILAQFAQAPQVAPRRGVHDERSTERVQSSSNSDF